MPYRFLTRLGFVGDTHLHLVLADCVIKLEGTGLTPLRKKLALRKVTFIQTFNAHVYPDRPTAGETCITSVQVYYGREGETGPGAN